MCSAEMFIAGPKRENRWFVLRSPKFPDGFGGKVLFIFYYFYFWLHWVLISAHELSLFLWLRGSVVVACGLSSHGTWTS